MGDGMGRRRAELTHAGRSHSRWPLALAASCMAGPGRTHAIRRKERQGDLCLSLRPICRVVRACMRRGGLPQIRPSAILSPWIISLHSMHACMTAACVLLLLAVTYDSMCIIFSNVLASAVCIFTACMYCHTVQSVVTAHS
jgi:hypothetical protein